MFTRQNYLMDVFIASACGKEATWAATITIQGACSITGHSRVQHIYTEQVTKQHNTKMT